jgi:arsenite oxidase large subunit
MHCTDGKFDAKVGKASLKPAPWNASPKPVAGQKVKHKFWVNKGRANEVWQTAHPNRYDTAVRDRYPMAFLEVNRDDAKTLGANPGDVVEIVNDLLEGQ